MNPAASHRAPRPPGGRSPSWVLGLSWVLGAAGIATLVTGTFLPWVVSGSVHRNLYTIAGIAYRMGLLGSAAPVADWLPLAGALCVVPAVLVVVGLRRTGAVAGLVLALAYGGGSVVAMVLAAGRSAAGVALATAGPVTVVIGALLLVAGAVGQLAAPPARAGRDRLIVDHTGSQQTPTNGISDGPH